MDHEVSVAAWLQRKPIPKERYDPEAQRDEIMKELDKLTSFDPKKYGEHFLPVRPDVIDFVTHKLLHFTLGLDLSAQKFAAVKLYASGVIDIAFHDIVIRVPFFGCVLTYTRSKDQDPIRIDRDRFIFKNFSDPDFQRLLKMFAAV